MNTYSAIFYFNGEWIPFKFTANQLANMILDQTDQIADFHYEDETQSLSLIKRIENKEYDIVFSADNPKCISVYETYENGGELVQANIPWLLLKVVNPQNEVLYNINKTDLF